MIHRRCKMKQLFKILLIFVCISLLNSCYKDVDNRSGTSINGKETKEDNTLTANVQDSTQTKMPILFVDNNRTHIKDLIIREDYCMIPLWKTLCALGAEPISNSKHDTYCSVCFKYENNIYVIDWTKQYLITDEKLGELETENGDNNQPFNNAKGYDLMPTVFEEKGANAYFWVDREVYIGYNTFIQLMGKLGTEVSINWDCHDKTVSIETQD